MYSVGHSEMSEIKPLFGHNSKAKNMKSLSKRRRLNTARIQQLSKETRQHKLGKNYNLLPLRMINPKTGKEPPVDREKIKSKSTVETSR